MRRERGMAGMSPFFFASMEFGCGESMGWGVESGIYRWMGAELKV